MDHSAFDNQFTTGQLQMLKVLLPCFPPTARKSLTVFIKFQEFKYTLDILNQGTPELLSHPEDPLDPHSPVLDQLYPFCDTDQKEKINSIRQMKSQMEQMQEMMEMAQMMQDLFPQGDGEEGIDFSQLANMLQGIQFQKGDSNGRMDER